ncbi:UvrD-helicase domain-containing protein [Marinococcus luteus]|uniref:UvrD-helicase domain-containing protein n=1 Tax=Marinococcus luteus TaxID=1122204 RepID=UPI000A84C2BC|nr:UvrD-helicase domain-containing protein [Marinococcus luteus]
MSNTIADQKARERITEDLDMNMLVEAGAGSGKTTSMVGRMAALIMNGKAEVAQITAITFTKKAADELRFRFRQTLEEKVKEAGADPEQIDRCQQALFKIDECFIGTVHAFCARLLRERPIEAGVDIAFREIEEDEDEELLYEAWVSHIEEQQAVSSEQYKILQDIGVSMSDLFQNLKLLSRYPEVQWVQEQTTKPDIDAELWQQMVNLCTEAQSKITLDARKPDDLEKIIVEFLRECKFVESDSDKISALEYFMKSTKVTQKNWISNEEAKAFKSKFDAIIDQEIDPLLTQRYEYNHSHILAFLEEGLKEYEQIKYEKGCLNYQDLLLKAKKLLQSHTHVREDLQEKYRYLLVDEFQDTDPIQAEIMFLLTAEDPTCKEWQRCAPKEGSLFIVGDPKQSIYRFRRADIDMYLAVKQHLENTGGKILALTTNFRTIPAVTNPFNSWLKSQLPVEAHKYQAEYQPLIPDKSDAENQWEGFFKNEVATDQKNEVVENRDAEQIAAHIQKMLSEGHEPEDMLVLQRNNKSLTKYARILEQYDIPVNVSGEIAYQEIPEFDDLASIFEAVADGSNELAVVAALKSVFFAASDAEFYEWKHAGGGFRTYSGSPFGEDTTINTALEKLRHYQRNTRSYSAAEVMVAIINDIDLVRHLALNGRGKESLQGYDLLIETLMQKSFSTLADGASWYRVWIEKKQKTLEQNMHENAVRVMNVHKAKGLEAPIVFLANPKGKSDAKNRIDVHIERENELTKGYILFQKTNGFQKRPIAQPPQWENAKAGEGEFQEAEAIRLLYVAATRAENMVVISSSGKNTNNYWQPLLEEMEIAALENQEVVAKEIDEPLLVDKNLVEISRNYESELNEAIKHSVIEEWSPTGDKDQPIPTIAREEGGGTEWGTFIHSVLEKVVQGKAIDRFIRNLAFQYEFDEEQIQKAFSIIDSFKASDVYQEVKNAQAVYTEWPFYFDLSPEEEGYTALFGEEKKAKRVKGFIDLVYLTEEGWKIVDYKTDLYVYQEDKEKLERFYQKQIEQYKVIWELLSGEKVHSMNIYFAR